MSIVEYIGDSIPRGIIKHWERKTKRECAYEIERCYRRISELKKLQLPQEAEPVAWTLRWPHDIKQGTVNYMTTFKTKERAREYADECTNRESIVVSPMFLHPPKLAAKEKDDA